MYIILAIMLMSFLSYAEEVEVKRDILALYDSSEGKDKKMGEYFENPHAGVRGKQKVILSKGNRSDQNLIFEALEMPLNYLGMKVTYWDVNQGHFPSSIEMKKYRAVMSWFEDNIMTDPHAYGQWLIQQLKEGRKVIILGEVGAAPDSEEARDVFKRMGLEWKGGKKESPWRLEITKKVSQMVEFERSFSNEVKNYVQVKSQNPQNKVYLSVKERSSLESFDEVIKTPMGGYVAQEYTFYEDQNTGFKQWRLNPFLFLEEVLDLKHVPHPDVTTLEGKRILFIHVDGDGFINVSQIKHKQYSSEIVLEEILRKFKIPHTISVIAAEVDEKHYGNSQSIRVAKDIFSLPTVEAGCHGYSHPMDWETKTMGMNLRGYTFSTEKEIVGCRNFINQHLLQKNKKVTMMLWSGMCNPPEEAIALTQKAGLYNINGHESFFDEDHPSYFYVKPLFRQVGEYAQPLSRAGSEYLYTEFWTENYGAFKNVIETFKRTENPRRISPINIYYHFYIGERSAALNSLKAIYEWVLSQPVFPIFTTHYIDILQGFLSVKIFKTSSGWKVEDVGKLRTLRFDQGIEIDLKKSRGIKGIKTQGGAFYISLKDVGPYELVVKK
ncbi:MAG TPA: hypothetical protein DD708_05325 [Deltaproteobacteria bacterium]|nr:hypothetical protein [Deltaproteobacteria bacterium]